MNSVGSLALLLTISHAVGLCAAIGEPVDQRPQCTKYQ